MRTGHAMMDYGRPLAEQRTPQQTFQLWSRRKMSGRSDLTDFERSCLCLQEDQMSRANNRRHSGD